MGKRVIIAASIAVASVLCLVSNVYADTTKDVLDAYDIKDKTVLEKTEEELKKKSKEYRDLLKDYIFTDFYNTAISLTSSNDVMNELNATQEEIRMLESNMLSCFDEPISKIKEYDNAYLSKRKYADFLLKALDSYSGLGATPLPEGNLQALEMELNDVQNKYSELFASSNIGNIDSLVHPVQALMKISSKYGTRINPNDTSKTEMHDGIDFEAEEGTGVVSLFSGKVIYAGYDEVKGETVKIKHGDGIVTEYRHLDERYVLKGTKVRQYQKIGTVGTTGENVGKPHLHLSLYINGKSYDPSKLLAKEGSK